MTEDTTGSQVAVLALPGGGDVHAYKDVGQRRASHILAETRHAVAVTRQGSVEPQVADLGAFAQTAEEAAHTLGAPAGGAIEVGGNGNLVALCIERAYVGICELHVVDLLADAADKSVAVGAVSGIIDVGSHHSIQVIPTGIHSMCKKIQLFGRINIIDAVVVRVVPVGVVHFVVTGEGNHEVVNVDILSKQILAQVLVQLVAELAAHHLLLGEYGLFPVLVAVVHEVVLVVLPFGGPLRGQLIEAVLGNHQVLVVTRHGAVLLLAVGVLRLVG